MMHAEQINRDCPYLIFVVVPDSVSVQELNRDSPYLFAGGRA
jgi:hypothetical protein